ncbi:right-handed parallel beta-helix repeat-containing protein [Cellulophaga lytica]|uniref:right-handed parallel beta-helix repeat-containing protein n=1 Tax=Cellulophaga lytica TaxID=979 RepID=UPI000B5CDC85|nr:right-handed parallel beta-helix repeat-containing protein [Cellulophaga lytica]SNQ43015.1 exported hypothetical protein [Cellulophaga lytica]
MMTITNYLKTALLKQKPSLTLKAGKFKTLLMLIFSSLLFISHIQESKAQTRPTTLYVDASYTGTTASDGSETYPFKTIRAALDYRGNVLGIANMVSDEQIIVKPGTYYPTETTRIFITSANGGKGSNWFTLKAQGEVIINGRDLYSVKFASLIAVTSNAQNVRIQGFKLENMRCNESLKTIKNDTIIKDSKFGIQLANTSKNVEIVGNEIYDFSWTPNVDPLINRVNFNESEKAILKSATGSDNCGPINVTGTDTIAIKEVVIKNNYIHHVIPGWTEGIQVNGHVIGFDIINNTITEVQNIGIVAAGRYEWVMNITGATLPVDQNYARDGLIKNNKVTSCRSPIAAAAGIYCDGSKNVTVENNIVSDGQVGFSIGNETKNTNSGGHTLKNNIAYDNSYVGYILGVPEGKEEAYVDSIKVIGNTSYRNGSTNDTYLNVQTGAELIINRNVRNLTVKNNIFYAVDHKDLVVVAKPSDANVQYLSTIDFDYNIYYTDTEGTYSGFFDWSNAGGDRYGNFAYYQQQKPSLDQNSQFVDPKFVNTTGPNLDFNLLPTSGAIDAGDPLYTVAEDEVDYLGNERIFNDIIDAGAIEYGASIGDQSAAIDGVNSASENYIALQTGVNQGVWSSIYAYDDENFVYVYAEYSGSLPEYSIFVNTNSSTGFKETWVEKTNYYVDGSLNLLNAYNENGNAAWPFAADNSVMNVRCVKTATTIEGRIPKYALGIGNTGTIGLGIIGYTNNWPTSVGSIPLQNNGMVYLTLNGGSGAGTLAVDGYKSPVEDYQPLITGVTGSSFSSIYGYADDNYIYLYADIDAQELDEYNVFINTNGATGHPYMWTDKTDYFIDANYNVLHQYNGASTGWPFSNVINSEGIEFVMTPTSIEGKILKSQLGLGNSGTIGIGIEGHTKNWGNSLGAVPTNGNSMVYLSLGASTANKAATASKVITVSKVKEEVDVTNLDLIVYPNPAINEISINYAVEIAGEVSIQLVGMDGAVYFSKNTYVKSGNHTAIVPVESLLRGMVILKVKTPHTTTTKKIILK